MYATRRGKAIACSVDVTGRLMPIIWTKGSLDDTLTLAISTRPGPGGIQSSFGPKAAERLHTKPGYAWVVIE